MAVIAVRHRRDDARVEEVRDVVEERRRMFVPQKSARLLDFRARHSSLERIRLQALHPLLQVRLERVERVAHVRRLRPA